MAPTGTPTRRSKRVLHEEEPRTEHASQGRTVSRTSSRTSPSAKVIPTSPFEAARRSRTNEEELEADNEIELKPSPNDLLDESAGAKPVETSMVVALPDVGRKDLTADEVAELRAFDMTMSFGPSVGLSRRERWERAKRLGMDPPVRVQEILQGLSKDSPHNEGLLAAYPL
uniref:DNA polymerase delta subunit 4 n=1 Tax=Chrysotila carterae TaxID=13221 RepID=A0A7S4EXH0_CHRCT|mmetsp:Transcript_55831/g.121583  ORF Transcript_55831/g.121583 Transcript_55831/m.121583 type:complete len:171 (+) Transcript_55831:258-770(+)